MLSHGGHILNGARKNPTQMLKRAIIGTFHQSLVKIGQVVSEEVMKMSKVYDDDDIQRQRRTQSDEKSSHGLKYEM